MFSTLTVPLFYFPSTILFVDDNKNFLSSIRLKIDNQLITAALNDPQLALDFLKSKITNNTLINIFADFPNNDINRLDDFFNNSNRFNEVSILVVDQDMPNINGIELCRALKNHPIKKIMLTGVSDSKVAIQAFNEGLIDKFILKNSIHIFKDLNSMINDLQHTFFLHLSLKLMSTGTNSLHPFLQEAAFCEFLINLCIENNISEYYILNNEANFLLIDYNGNTFKLIVSPNSTSEGHDNPWRLSKNNKYYYQLTTFSQKDNIDNEKVFSHRQFLDTPDKNILIDFDHLKNISHIEMKASEKKLNEFTSRELDCITLLMQGYTVKMMASKLGISPRTVETYIENVKNKTGCINKSSLINYFQENGLYT